MIQDNIIDDGKDSKDVNHVQNDVTNSPTILTESTSVEKPHTFISDVTSGTTVSATTGGAAIGVSASALFLTSAGGPAALGAAIGSAVPVIGTITGAIIGVAIGSYITHRRYIKGKQHESDQSEVESPKKAEEHKIS